MSKVAHYLQEHITGEVVSSVDARRYFSTDGSIVSVTPAVIVYPRSENDVRKIARFTWQLAERGRVIPMTPRGNGTGVAGGAVGNGIVLSFPAHMNKIQELDSRSGVVVVEPGINFGRLQQTLNTHDRFLPPYPASMEYSTVGGAAADNAGGDKSVKYGVMRDYVKGLRVVLANGEVIETQRLSRRELGKKLGLATFEGEIYRSVDALIEENARTIEDSARAVTKNAAGYAISAVKNKDGSFDLTPLFVGAQGTLGIITEIVLDTEPFAPSASLIAASFDDLKVLEEVVLELRKLPELPSAVEMVDEHLLKAVDILNPNQLRGVTSKPFPKAMLLIEFDSLSDRTQKKLVKRTKKLLEKLAVNFEVAKTPEDQERLWRVRHAASTIVGHSEGNTKALPIIEDGVVPPEKLAEYIEELYKLFERSHVRPAVWGHAGDGHLHVQPLLDLSTVGDRQKVFRLMEEYYDLVIKLGGSISGGHGEGRIRAPFLEKQYGTECYAMFRKLKQIFDPYGTLNPGVKIDVSSDTVKSLMRQSYSLDHAYTHLPRS